MVDGRGVCKRICQFPPRQKQPTGICALADIGVLEAINYLHEAANALAPISAQLAHLESRESKEDYPVITWWSNSNSVAAVHLLVTRVNRQSGLGDCSIDVHCLVASVVCVFECSSVQVRMFECSNVQVRVKKRREEGNER